MAPRTRNRPPSAAQLSQLVARPGIDTRVWLALAVVEELGYDSMHGVFADVTMLETGEEETCLVGAAYAGDRFGMYFPPKVGDTVLVAVPQGDPEQGPTIICRMWSASDPPPAELAGATVPGGTAPTEDVVLRVESGKNLKIFVSGTGTITLKSENADIVLNTPSGVVKLGTDTVGPLDGFVHGSGFDPFTGQTYTAIGNASSKVKGAKS